MIRRIKFELEEIRDAFKELGQELFEIARPILEEPKTYMIFVYLILLLIVIYL
jgi:hypothetical protein